MFDSWLEQEKADIRSRFGNARVLCLFLALLMVPLVLLNLILLLDGGGAMAFVAGFFGIFVLIIILSMGNYKKRFLKPLLASIEKELPSEEDRQKFAREMTTYATCISYQPLPQTKSCDIMVAESYCYMRQPRKSRIIRNSEIRRVVLTQENYSTGTIYHLHSRRTYALALYTADNEQKPAWKGYFTSDGELYRAFACFKSIVPQETVIEDNVAAGKIGDGRKAPLWTDLLAILIILAIVILAWASRTGRLG